jgi:hypothetical protein
MMRADRPAAQSRTSSPAHVFLAATALSLSACPRPPTPPHERSILGSREDLKTSAGTHEGFTFETDCRERDCFGIAGMGTNRVYPSSESMDDAALLAATKRAQARVLAAVQGVRSIDLTADGTGCHRQGIIVWLHDWRDADEVIARVGRTLSSDRSADEVTLCVAPPLMLQTK